MRVLVTGSSGHLGEALTRVLAAEGCDVVGLDVVASPSTARTGSLVDRPTVRRSLEGVDAVVHTATLHKPHVSTHSRQDFVDTNVSGTLILLEEAVRAGVGAVVFTSTTSAFGRALSPHRACLRQRPGPARPGLVAPVRLRSRARLLARRRGPP